MTRAQVTITGSDAEVTRFLIDHNLISTLDLSLSLLCSLAVMDSRTPLEEEVFQAAIKAVPSIAKW